jgi:hypothetical protein
MKRRNSLARLFTRFTLLLVLVLSLTPVMAMPAFADQDTATPPNQAADQSVETNESYSVDASLSEAQLDAAAAFSTSASFGTSDGAYSQGKEATEISAGAPTEADIVVPETSAGKKQELNIELIAGDSKEDEATVAYSTTLMLRDVNVCYGYQIEVKAASEDAITINNLIGGMTTDSVYKDGSAHQAVLLSNDSPLAGDIAICEITSRFPLNEDTANRVLTVVKLEVVNSLATGSMLTAGPEPVAASLALASASVISVNGDFDVLPFVIALMVAVLLATVIIFVYRYIRSRKTDMSILTGDVRGGHAGSTEILGKHHNGRTSSLDSSARYKGAHFAN